MATCLGKAFPSLEESLCAKSGKAGGGRGGGRSGLAETLTLASRGPSPSLETPGPAPPGRRGAGRPHVTGVTSDRSQDI